MRNIALKLRYDGTAYHGWQVQKTETSVAETLEKALSKVCGEPDKGHRLRPDGRGRARALATAPTSARRAGSRWTGCPSR